MGAVLPAAPKQDVERVEAGIAAFIHEFKALRRDLHEHPELSFQEHRTSAIVAERLAHWGYSVTTGIAGTGVVGTLRRGQGSKALGIRADMDALPITEATGLPYASRNAGVMHACGHDGHTTVLLAAARFLAESGRFDGTLNLIFQPAEEHGGGANRMIGEGLFERFPCDAVFGLHNWPCVGEGHFGCVTGPAMASVDQITITVRGKGGHAAQPQHTPDAILVASQLVAQLNTIVSRRIDPSESAVLSVTRIEGGHSHNVLPAEVQITGTVRSFDATVQDRIEAALRATCQGMALASGTEVLVNYQRYYPATLNTAAQAALALDAAQAVGLQAQVAPRAAFTSEDFAFMLQRKPGAYLWLGQGRADPGPEGEWALHHPCYDFNDDALPLGVRWFCEIAARALARRRLHGGAHGATEAEGEGVGAGVGVGSGGQYAGRGIATHARSRSPATIASAPDWPCAEMPLVTRPASRGGRSATGMSVTVTSVASDGKVLTP